MLSLTGRSLCNHVVLFPQKPARALPANIRQLLVKAALSALVTCSYLACLPLFAEEPQIRIVHGSDIVEIQTYAPNIVGIHLMPGGNVTPRTLVMDPALKPAGGNAVRIEKNGAVQTLSSPEMKVLVNDASTALCGGTGCRRQNASDIEERIRRRARTGAAAS